MTLRRIPLFSLLLLLAATAGSARAASTYPDPAGDVKGGAGPDVTSVTLSSTAAAITFRVRFADAPPLRLSTRGKWVDMLLIGIDVPPIGALPSTPGGEWRGADFALGTHGPSQTGLLVRLGGKRPAAPARFRIVTRGRTLSFSIPRRALGSPRRFTFNVATAREGESGAGGGLDLAPARGTFRYVLP